MAPQRDKRRGQRGIRRPCRGLSLCTHTAAMTLPADRCRFGGQRQTWGAPAERSGFFSVGRVYFTGMPMRRRSVAGSLPRRGVGCCVPQLTHLRSQDIHRRQPLGRSGFLAPAPPSWPGLFFWWWRSCCGERRPSVPLTQIKATDALLRMIKVGSGRPSQGRGGRDRPAFPSPLRAICGTAINSSEAVRLSDE